MLAVTSTSDSSARIGSELVPSPSVRTSEASSAISKENPIPLFEVFRNFSLVDFPSLCGLRWMLVFIRAGSRICTLSTYGWSSTSLAAA